ncbi:glucosaminidase domain-containing protein [Photobacterium damselae]|uniref:glucosaminidase domain-containing protein n=1 Tax=Photobacterium damselae TaxID=38293 RepID=UPI002543D624
MTRITTVGVITLVAAVSAAAIYKAKVRNDHQVDLAPSPIMMEQILNNKPNFAVIDSEADKKKAFFQYLTPDIVRENNAILKDRENLLALMKKPEKMTEKNAFLIRLSNHYAWPMPAHDEKTSEPISQQWLTGLLDRVDVLPVPLVLSQAAIESGWGTSRFAVEGDNYFGLWCYSPGCGLAPLEEKDSKNYHEVARFNSLQHAVDAYFLNMNTNPEFQPLRDKRAQLRAEGLPLTATDLAPELIHYSQIGQRYIEEINTILHQDGHLMLIPEVPKKEPTP